MSCEVSDVTGAGDTVVAVLGTALAAGMSLTDSARLANVAAGLVVTRQGTAVVTARELAASLLRRDLSTAELKVIDAATAATRAAVVSAVLEHPGRRVIIGCWQALSLRTNAVAQASAQAA